MKIILLTLIIAFSAPSRLFAEIAETEVVATMNRAQAGVAGGNIKALDELTKLPGNYSTPAFLTIFKQNAGGFNPSPTDKAVRLRCAQLAVSTPGGAEYLTKLLKGKATDNRIFYQQDSAMKCLVTVHDKISIGILCGALNDIEPAENGPKLVSALASLNLPGAPYSVKARVNTDVALEKWKEWWAAIKDRYEK